MPQKFYFELEEEKVSIPKFEARVMDSPHAATAAKKTFGPYEIRVRQLTTGDSLDVQYETVSMPDGSASTTQALRSAKFDRKKFEMLLAVRSIVPESWPVEDLGELSLETFEALPANFTAPIRAAVGRINAPLTKQKTDFLDSSSASAVKATKQPQQSTSRKTSPKET